MFVIKDRARKYFRHIWGSSSHFVKAVNSISAQNKKGCYVDHQHPTHQEKEASHFLVWNLKVNKSRLKDAVSLLQSNTIVWSVVVDHLSVQSLHGFLSNDHVWKRWIAAIRRDESAKFTILWCSNFVRSQHLAPETFCMKDGMGRSRWRKGSFHHGLCGMTGKRKIERPRETDRQTETPNITSENKRMSW